VIRWLLLAALLLTVPARAADITVLSAGAINTVAAAVKPSFEASTGHTVTLRNDTVGALVRRIGGGEAFDVVLMSPAGLRELGARIAPGSTVTLAQVGVGVGIKAGSPPPDIGTVDAFKATMLNARSVAYIDPASGGSSGIYIAKLFRTLGIADAMAAKSVLVNGGLAATALLDGRADIALQQASEIVAVPGVALAGPLPPEIQVRTTYAGAVGAAAAQPGAARAFLAAMQAPAARAAVAASGMTAP
jgi:molybdate transport system substrate-binding protein